MMRWQLQDFTRTMNSECELRAQENKSQMYGLLNGQLVRNQNSSNSGLSARTYKNGVWGFSSIPEISTTAADRVIGQATTNAGILAERAKNHGATLQTPGARGQKSWATQRPRITSKEIIDFIKALDAGIEQKYPDVRSRRISALEQNFEKELLTTSGAHCYSLQTRSFINIELGMDGANGPVTVTDILGGIGQFEDTLPSDEEAQRTIAEIYRNLKNKSKAVPCEAGYKDVVLHSRLAGILAHEAIGHTVEADIVLGGSVAGDYLQQVVASPIVNLVDYAHTAIDRPCPLPVFFDDEGIEAQDTVIIENGVLKNFMHSRESAAHFGHTATGHARAWGFNDEPLIRMRNTAIVPGKDKLEDMIASVEDGYYLIDPANGQADSTSEFMFGVSLGYEIKNGKIGRAISDTTISGVAFDMLKTITAISDEMTWLCNGHCGKKQLMTVGMGGPAIKCKINVGGR